MFPKHSRNICVNLKVKCGKFPSFIEFCLYDLDHLDFPKSIIPAQTVSAVKHLRCVQQASLNVTPSIGMPPPDGQRTDGRKLTGISAGKVTFELENLFSSAYSYDECKFH